MQDFVPQRRLYRCRCTRWRVPRSIGAGDRHEVVDTLEDTPFYARSIVAAEVYEPSRGGDARKPLARSICRPMGPGDAAISDASDLILLEPRSPTDVVGVG